MKALRRVCALLLMLILAAGLGAGFLARSPYAAQDRDHLSAAPSCHFPLGTDELGRDRFSRLLYGCRVSLLLAPAAALLSLSISALAGILAGHWGGWRERVILSATDLVLSLPWLFLMLTIRALLPLNMSPWLSVVVTFALLGMLGWAAAARVIHAGVRSLRNSDFVLQARACGCPPGRLMLAHIVPNLKPVLLAQFWILIPAFLLSEANLGLLGLGVAEPLPSLGALLREMEDLSALRSSPWLLAPAGLLLVIVSSLHVVLSKGEPVA
jgi:ABC-type dipeptide/oligopeptide/nickel transport system permease subunit